MFKVLSDFLLSIGIHPIVGGFLLGILFCVVLLVIKKALGIEVHASTSDELSRFRDPNAFSRGSSVTETLSIQSDSDEKVLPDHVSGEVMRALREGKKIEAIKIFRDATGLGLKESKDIVEALQSKLGL